ncbi:MAG: DNA mismatch repair endonuclease MutL [Clostridia bacterium]|nr:DNA mismatch repair endonuclease MutL [Clostridia bacterium]
MGSIVLLDEHTINKIAAGEVVDRPSSIVKELIENSIDAKATAINIEINKGGISYIKITDNGIGFASDDMELAFERHATSKIRKEEDLLHITSMGFRGEALASIAAISKVTLTSRNEKEEIGKKVTVEAGDIKSSEQVASNVGTKIEIKDVFYNVPARFKFLKKDFTEAGYIEDVVIRTAISNPQISFKYVSNGKVVLQTSGNGDINSVIYDIFGKDIYQNIIPVNYELNDMKVEGVIGLPSVSRSTRKQQFTYINARYIKNKTISTAIDKACEQKYAINKFAFVVLNITIHPEHIDVNVHPAKLEVKFDDEAKVFDTVYYAVKSALEKKEETSSPFSNIKTVETVDKISKISTDLLNNGMLKNEIKYNNTEKKFDFARTTEESSLPLKEELSKNYSVVIDGNSVKEEPTFTIPKEIPTLEIVENVNSPITYEAVDILQKEELAYKYVGQVFDTYIIIQIKEKMYIIDQHAAHERLLFEQIKEAYYAKDKQSQLLLIPILVELLPKEKEIVDQNIEMFEKAGFMLDDFDDVTIKISGVPNIGYDIEYKSMFKDMVDDLLGAFKTEKSEKEFRFLATLACKAAVKGRMKLDTKEQISLIDQMVKLENPFTCPHGRPTAYEISKYEIERRFLRK